MEVRTPALLRRSAAKSNIKTSLHVSKKNPVCHLRAVDLSTVPYTFINIQT